MKKKVKEEVYDDSWIFILLLTTFTILAESLKNYRFDIQTIYISYGALLLPIIVFLLNFITKKYGYKRGVAALSISGVITVCFMAVMAFAMGRSLILSNLTGEFCGYVACGFVNLLILVFLLNNTRVPWILLFINYLSSMIIFSMFYTFINLNDLIYVNFWPKFFITFGIQAGISIIISAIDSRIKRGRITKK